MTVESKRVISVTILLAILIAAVSVALSIDEIRHNATQIASSSYDNTIGAVINGAERTETSVTSADSSNGDDIVAN